jgi:hypothetical protein
MSGLVEHGQALQHTLGDLSVLTVRDLVQLFKEHDDGEHFPTLLRKAFGEIVRPYVHAAGQITAQWYHELDPRSNYRPTPWIDLPDARIDKTVDWSLNARTSKAAAQDVAKLDQADIKESVPRDVTLGRLAGSSKRMVADGSRTTVIHNATKEGVRWARLAAEDACAFCRMLATRSEKQLYRSHGVIVDKIGVHRTVVVGRHGHARGSRPIGETYHDHCRCVAVPIRAGSDWVAPGYVSDWQDQYEDAAKAAGKGATFKDVLAKMRSVERGSELTDEHVHDLPPVELDEPVHA